MTWTEKLKQFSGLGGDTHRTEMAVVLPLVTVAMGRLNRVAALAPTPVVQSELAPVVAKAEAVVQRLRDALHDYGPASASTRSVAAADGRNHWARLLEALEQHREVRQRLRELSISVEDTNQALSQALVDIGREEGEVLERLRDLIARADPQALN